MQHKEALEMLEILEAFEEQVSGEIMDAYHQGLDESYPEDYANMVSLQLALSEALGPMTSVVYFLGELERVEQ